MIEVRTMKLSAFRDKEEFLYSEASRQRRERASRFIHRDDRLRCLAAGYLMKHCLPGYSEALLHTGVDGKPFPSILHDGRGDQSCRRQRLGGRPHLDAEGKS